MPDELRAESIGCYGHPVVQTPNIDRLARQGTRFDQCHVQHTVCTPSRCSLMTGWYPHVRGHRSLWHLLQPDEPNLLKYLKQAGYDVRWWGKNDLLSQGAFADSVTTHGGPWGTMHGGNPFAQDDPRRQSFLYEPLEGDPSGHADARRVDAAIDYLKRGPDGPFALYLPLEFPHCPYSAPRPWHDQIDPDALPPLRPADLDGKPDFHRLIRRSRRLDELDEDVLRRINAVYLGMIGFVDHLLGRLLDTLDQTGQADDTAVVLFSDHGDWAGDYGLVEKWPSALDDCLTRVPLIFRVPGGVRGHRVAEPVELFDVMASCLDLARIEPAHAHFAQSLAPQVMGGAAGDPGRIVFAEGGYAPHDAHAVEGNGRRPEPAGDPGHIYYPKLRLQQDHPGSTTRSVMARTATEKLIYRPAGESEFYDLRTDPREYHNLYGDPRAQTRTRRLEGELLRWLVRTSDVTPYREDPRGHKSR